MKCMVKCFEMETWRVESWNRNVSGGGVVEACGAGILPAPAASQWAACYSLVIILLTLLTTHPSSHTGHGVTRSRVSRVVTIVRSSAAA